MQLQARHLRQVATLWRLTGLRDPFGAPTYHTPVQVAVRWSDASEVAVTAAGEQFVSTAAVHVAFDTEIQEGDWLAAGRHLEETPALVDAAHQVRRVTVVPRLYNAGGIKKVML